MTALFEQATSRPVRSVPTGTALKRGLVGRCPACGEGRLFGRFLKVADTCPACHEPMHHHRADDFPPYIVMFIVGHVVVWGVLQAELRYEVPMWVHLAVWPVLTLALAVLLLQPVKGAVVGLQYALGMHGFGEARRRDATTREEARFERDTSTVHHRPADLHRS